MKPKYTADLLASLRQKQRTVTERGLPILEKPIPDESRPGMMDPRLYAQMSPMFKGIKGFIVKQVMKNMASKPVDPGQLRKLFNSVKSLPVTNGVKEIRLDARHDGLEIPLRIYLPERQSNKLVPIFYYIHGGGFVAGRPEVVEEMCKMVVQNTGCISIQPNYRLAPEHPYPAGLDDCYAALKWIYANAEEYGGDKEKVCISGDSAGGNYATVCAMRSRDEGTHMVKTQALIYPTVNMASAEDENFHFSLEEYTVDSAQAPVIHGMIEMLKGAANGSLAQLLGVQNPAIPYVSPYLGKLEGMPPCIILYGEFDYLRVENEAYARKLQKAGVEVKAVRYLGLSHGFADNIGILPQAEDCMLEIGDFMMAHLE